MKCCDGGRYYIEETGVPPRRDRAMTKCWAHLLVYLVTFTPELLTSEIRSITISEFKP